MDVRQPERRMLRAGGRQKFVDRPVRRVEQQLEHDRHGDDARNVRQEEHRFKPIFQVDDPVDDDGQNERDDHLDRHDQQQDQIVSQRNAEYVVLEQLRVVVQPDEPDLVDSGNEAPVGEAEDERNDRRNDGQHRQADQHRGDEDPPRQVLPARASRSWRPFASPVVHLPHLIRVGSRTIVTNLPAAK